MNKLFCGGEWHIGLRRATWDCQNAPCVSGLYNAVPNPKAGWLADPFLFDYCSETYLFAEYFINSKEKGAIGVSRIVDGKTSGFQVVIEEPFHMSYPVVFEYNGSVFMVPESGQGKRLCLYESLDFPYGWRCRDVIMRGVNYADTTLINMEKDIATFITYENNKGAYRITIFDYSLLQAKIIRSTSKTLVDNYCRPGGCPIITDDNILMPIQDCRFKYGQSLGFFHLSDICSFLNNAPEFELKKNDVEIIGVDNVTRVHTYNRSSNYEVIDALEERFDLFRTPKMMRRKLRSLLLSREN